MANVRLLSPFIVLVATWLAGSVASAHGPDAAVGQAVAGAPATSPHPAPAPAGATGRPAAAGAWSQGRLSRVRAVILRHPQYDKDNGTTAIEFEATAPGGAAKKRVVRKGIWVVIAYAEEAGAYLLGGLFQQGAWLPMNVLMYVDERTGVWRRSRVSGSRWMAMAAIPGPGGRYVAFVAEKDDKGFELQVLETATDRLARVGPPPAPPPLKRTDWHLCDDQRRAVWGELADGFDDMDSAVSFIDAQTLTASYGADTCRRRAAKRQSKQWALPEIFAARFP